MRVLVTGGNRYIGLHLVFELAQRGHDVTVLNSHLAPLPDGARRLHGDRTQPGVLREVLGPHRDGFEAVFDNTAYAVSDLEPMVELFRDRVQHFVFTSSVAVYKRSLIQPVRETFPTHAVDDPDGRKAYGVGKVACEQYLHRSGLPATSLRVTHTIGPRSPLAAASRRSFASSSSAVPSSSRRKGSPSCTSCTCKTWPTLMASVPGNAAAVGKTYNVAARRSPASPAASC